MAISASTDPAAGVDVRSVGLVPTSRPSAADERADPMSETHRALVVVDLQNDFTEGGRLAIEGADDVARRVGAFIAAHRDRYGLTVATADWHITPGTHFADDPDYVDTWPVHCVAGTAGAAFDEEVTVGGGVISPLELFDEVVYKGQRTPAYSGFEGTTAAGQPLADRLAADGITAIDVIGIALSHGVPATALDGQAAGFTATVLTDLSVGVSEELTEAALVRMADAGITLTTSDQLDPPA